ncbi:MAG TPA: CDP-alcohol phosphatidyltransferase family protein [Candidatus Obscuribacterales bacterium]
MKCLPDFLTLSRAVLAPALLWSAFCWEHRLGVLFLTLYVIGFLTDVFDGRLARRLGTVNPWSAGLDSQCDLIFHGSALACIVAFRPDVCAFYQYLIMLAVSAQVVHWSAGFFKFGRLVGYHTRWTKIWSVVLFVAVVEVSISTTSVLMLPALVLAIASSLEETAITYVLREYRTDVSSLRAALRLSLLRS